LITHLSNLEAAKRMLKRLTEAEEALSKIETEYQQRGEKDLFRVHNLDALDELADLSRCVSLFSCFSVESFLNLYGIVRLGEPFFNKHYERFGPQRKLIILVATCDGLLLGPTHEIVSIVSRLAARRNAIAHPTAKEWDSTQNRTQIPDIIVPGDARQSINDALRFFTLFREINGSVDNMMPRDLRPV
jgi:hypothetical protein